MNRRHFLVRGLGGAGLGAVGLPVLAQPAPAVLNLALIAPRDPDVVAHNWMPFALHVAAAADRRLQLKAYAQQDELTQDFLNGRVDLAWTGNLSALDIVEQGQGAVFAQMVSETTGAGYRPIMVGHFTKGPDSLVQALAQAPRLRLGMGPRSSVSGYLAPLYFGFFKHGTPDPQAIFKAVTHASHEQNLRGVSEGDIDLATSNDVELGLYLKSQPEAASRMRVIWQGPSIPQSPLMWSVRLPRTVRTKVAAAVWNYGEHPQEQQVLQRMNGLVRFRRSNNTQLLPVADLEMFKARQAIVHDTQLSPQERHHRVDAVIRRASALELRIKTGIYVD